MSETTNGPEVPALKLKTPGALELVQAGREAFRRVPGMRILMLKGFLLLYGLFALLGTGATVLVYRLVIRPQFDRLESYGKDGGWLMDILIPLLDFLVRLTQVMLLAAVLMLAFLVTLSLLSVWFEALAEKVVRHQRQAEGGTGFDFRLWMSSLLTALRDGLWLFLVALFSILLGFIPFIGPFLIFFINGYLLGWEVRQPYLNVDAALGRPKGYSKTGLTLWTTQIGVLPVVLAMIPVVGWLLLPAALIYMVAGMAWVNEQGVDQTSTVLSTGANGPVASKK